MSRQRGSGMPYSWHETFYPSPGAENFAFVPNMTLPVHDVTGPGNMVRSQLNAFQANEFMTVPTLPIAGLGGLVHGQIVGQPLIGDNS